MKLLVFAARQSVVSGVTTAYNREQLWLANETLITKLQARCRGYLVRNGLKERMSFLKTQEPAVTRIQVRRTRSLPELHPTATDSLTHGVFPPRPTGKATNRGRLSPSVRSI